MLATKARRLGAAHTLHAAVKNLRNLDVKASLARDLREIDQYAYGLALSRLVLEAGYAETSLWR